MAIRAPDGANNGNIVNPFCSSLGKMMLMIMLLIMILVMLLIMMLVMLLIMLLIMMATLTRSESSMPTIVERVGKFIPPSLKEF